MDTGMGMTPYFVMLLIEIICIFREFSLKTIKEKRNNFIIALIPIFVFIGLKSEDIGRDTYNYLNTFSSFGSEIQIADEGKKQMEFGFQMLMIMLGKMFDGTQSLLITLALLTCVSLYYFIRNTATNWCLALYFFICLGFFQFVMSGIRQSMAIEIMLLAYPFIKKRRMVLYMLMVLVAFMFHKSAIVCAPLYFIANMTVNKRNTTMMIMIMTFLFFFSDTILLTTADVMKYDYGIERTDNGFVFLLIVLLITLFSYKNKNNILSSHSEAKNLFNANYVSVLLWIMRMVSRTVERVSLYFMPYTYVLLEQSLTTIPARNRKGYIVIAIAFVSILFLYRLSYQTEINDFRFFWQ